MESSNKSLSAISLKGIIFVSPGTLFIIKLFGSSETIYSINGLSKRSFLTISFTIWIVSEGPKKPYSKDESAAVTIIPRPPAAFSIEVTSGFITPGL